MPGFFGPNFKNYTHFLLYRTVFAAIGKGLWRLRIEKD